MRLLTLIGVACAVSLALATTGRSAGSLCVGGPHCFTTIQAALDAAPDGATIRVSPGTYAGGIVITKSVTLLGDAPAVTRISGGGPVVTIGSATSTPTVVLAGLAIADGAATGNPQAPSCGADVPTCGPGYADASALGGGIEAFPGTTVTVLRSAITGNTAAPAHATNSVKAVCPGPSPCPASFAAGAGIDNWGTMTLIGTTVGDNHASAVQANGGGIASERQSTLTLLGSRVVGNSADAVAPWGRFSSGGGIYADRSATLTIVASNVDGNAANLASSIPHPYPLQDGGTDIANAFGGGIQLAGHVTAAIRNSTIDGNSISVTNPVGEPFGDSAGMCDCGGSTALTLESTSLDDNTVDVHVPDTSGSGPSGPAALELDNAATVRNVRLTGNATHVTADSGDAGAIGALAVFLDTSVTQSIANADVSDNEATATAPHGAAAVAGAGILNNGPLVLANAGVDRNHAAATGVSGFAQGGGIWNAELFAGPTSSLTLQSSHVVGNVVSGSSGILLQGGGIFSLGFPLTLQASVVEHNAPVDCFGC
jgi:hypothetical protein